MVPLYLVYGRHHPVYHLLALPIHSFIHPSIYRPLDLILRPGDPVVRQLVMILLPGLPAQPFYDTAIGCYFGGISAGLWSLRDLGRDNMVAADQLDNQIT